MQFASLHDFLQEPAPLLVTTHVHPDGDAVSSLLAFGFLCERLGRQSVSAMADPIPDRFRFLPGANRVVVTQEHPLLQKFDAAVILDAGNLDRIGNLETCLAPSARIVNIDHHISNGRFGQVNILHLEAGATSQILFDIFVDFGFTPTPEEATCLYAGILTDTGRFRFANTTARALEIASQLVELGADPALITERIYYEIPPEDVHKMRRALETLEMFAGGEVCTLFLSSDAQVQDSDALVDLALSIQGVEVALLFSEMGDGRVRISLRSKNRVNVSKLAEHFGGGGHFKAAGLRMRGTMEGARERLLPVVIEAVSNRELPVVAV